MTSVPINTGDRFRFDDDSTWEVVEKTGKRTYSPSALGGVATYWCKPIGHTPTPNWYLQYARESDGAVEMCGDSLLVSERVSA